MNAPSPRPQAAKLADISPGYKVATEAFELASKYGVSGDAYDSLWDLVQREAKKAEAMARGA